MIVKKNKSKPKKKIFSNMKIVNSGHEDSLLNFESTASPKAFNVRKSSHGVGNSPKKSMVERRAIVSHFNSPKDRKFVVSISSTANTSVRTKSKYSFNAFSKKRIKNLNRSKFQDSSFLFNKNRGHKVGNDKSKSRSKSKTSQKKLQAEVDVPQLNILKTSEKSGDSININTGNKTESQVKLSESTKSNNFEKPAPIDTELAKKENSVHSKSNDASSGSPVLKDLKSANVPLNPIRMDIHTPEISSKKSLLVTTEENKSSNDDVGSEKGKKGPSKFKSEAPIKNLLKYDTNSSAINLLSPNNSSSIIKGKRKATGHSAHQDGASIVSANLSSEMGTAYFQGSARRKSATSRNESPELIKDIESIRQLHDEPMSFISPFEVVFT